MPTLISSPVTEFFGYVGVRHLERLSKMTPAQSPPLGSLRPAKLSDVPRIAIVAAAGFWHSSVFSFERPRFNRYPRDTLASYRSLYQQAILDPDSAVLVVEDDFQEDEVKEVYDALSIVYPPLEKQLPPEKLESSSVIVGVGSLSLKSDRSRYGLFQPEGMADSGSTSTRLESDISR